MEKRTYDSAIIVILAFVLTTLVASFGASNPHAESSLYRVYPPIVQDYGSPSIEPKPATPSNEELIDALKERNLEMARAREAALLLEAEVREMVETMEMAP